MSRETVRPDRMHGGECPEAPKGWFRKPYHLWHYSTRWNGNNLEVLPFVTTTRGIGRSGWRCYHCGKMVWDQTNTEFALTMAYGVGLIKLPKAPPKCEPVGDPGHPGVAPGTEPVRRNATEMQSTANQTLRDALDAFFTGHRFGSS